MGLDSTLVIIDEVIVIGRQRIGLIVLVIKGVDGLAGSNVGGGGEDSSNKSKSS